MTLGLDWAQPKLYFSLSPALAKPIRSTKIGLGLFGVYKLALIVTLKEQGAAVDFFAYFFHLQEKSLSAKRMNRK